MLKAFVLREEEGDIIVPAVDHDGEDKVLFIWQTHTHVAQVQVIVGNRLEERHARPGDGTKTLQIVVSCQILIRQPGSILSGGYIIGRVELNPQFFGKILFNKGFYKLPLRLVAFKVDAARHIHRKIVNVLFIDTEIPAVQHRLTLIPWHVVEEHALTFQPKRVHVKPGCQLMTEGAVDIKACHQGVVNSFQKRVINHPHGFRQATMNAFMHRGAVKVTIDRQQRCILRSVPFPDRIVIEPVIVVAGVIVLASC